MTDKEELQKAYERGVQDGMKREHALWQLAKIGQEIEAQPVAWMWDINNGAGYSSRGIGFEQTNIPFAKHTPLYAVPPQREWVGLTKEELAEISEFHFHGAFSGRNFYEDIETRLKEKNT
jgi:hypothetical protein